MIAVTAPNRWRSRMTRSAIAPMTRCDRTHTLVSITTICGNYHVCDRMAIAVQSGFFRDSKHTDKRASNHAGKHMGSLSTDITLFVPNDGLNLKMFDQH